MSDLYRGGFYLPKVSHSGTGPPAEAVRKLRAEGGDQRDWDTTGNLNSGFIQESAGSCRWCSCVSSWTWITGVRPRRGGLSERTLRLPRSLPR
ncbi:unnamed protein product [Pleuronectes platessa]|uniref:Uncharacterized protein n=1 Tax=Pleuronectes platessa TaxID=8262 RepID=A0A9N7V6W9_PLEPL|nr:unnamed protein product [Pleuronectes platessa]